MDITVQRHELERKEPAPPAQVGGVFKCLNILVVMHVVSDFSFAEVMIQVNGGC